MSQYELIVYLKGGKSKEDENLANDPSKAEKEKDKQAKQGERVVKAMAAWSFNTAKTLVVSKVGEFARDNHLQRKINAAMDIAETAIYFYVNPILGAVNMTVKIASSMIDKNIATSKQANRLSVLGERAGYINRSRD